LVEGVLESPIGAALTKVGEAVALPGKVVTSGLREAIDIFDSDVNTKASWDDFTKQVADPTFGFGKIVGDVTGNKWADRLIGFAGDVLLDPLTYMTLGSTKALKVLDDAGDVATGMRGLSVASADGRISLAKRVLEMTGDKALSTKVARYGRAAIKDPSVFERVGLDRAGLYFMGKRMPGSTRIGEAVERGFATMRTWSGDHMFKRSNELFTLADASAARRMLLRGQAGADDGADYLYTVISANTQRAAKAESARRAASSLQEMVGRFGLPQLNEAGIAVRRAIESGTVDQLEGLPREMAESIDQWFKSLWGEVEGVTRAVDPNAPLGFIQNYIPMMASDNALRDMARAYDSRFASIKEFTYNPLDPAGSFRHRMQEGDDFFGYTLKAEDVGDIDRMNQIAREYGKIDYDFYETDIMPIMARYIDQFSDQMGVVARKKYLVDKGVFQKLEAKYYIDEDAWKQTRKTVQKVTAARTKAAADASSAVDNVLKQFDSLLRTQADEIQMPNAEAYRTLRGLSDSNRAQAKHLAKIGLREAYDNLDKQRGTLHALMGERPPQVVRILEEKIERILPKIERLTSEIDNITDNGVELAQSKMRAIQQEIADIEKQERMLNEFGNLIESQLDDILTGKQLPGLENISKAIADSFVLKDTTEGGRKALIGGVSGVPTPESKELYRSIEREIKAGPVAGPPGKMTPGKRAHIDRVFRERGGAYLPSRPGAVDTEWWKNSNPVAEITPTAVVNMTPEKVAEVVSKAMRGEASVQEMRTAVLSIASRNINHPAELWTKVFGTGMDGSGVMARAAESDAFFKSIDGLKKNRAKFTRLIGIRQNIDEVLDATASDLSQYAAATGLLKRIFSIGTFDENSVVPLGMLKQFLDQPEFASLRNLFARYIDDGVDDIVTEAWSVARNIEASDVLGMGVVGSKKVVGENGVDFVGASGLREVERSLPDLTFGQFVSSLRGIVDTIDDGGIRRSITFTPTGAAKNLKRGAVEAAEETIVIRPSTYADEIYYMVENGEEWPAISSRIEEIVYGRPPKEAQAKTVKGVNRVSMYKGPVGEIGNPLLSIRERAAEISKNIREEFPGFIDADSIKIYNSNGELSSISMTLDIGGKKKSLSQRAAEDARDELANTMLEFWFRSEVEERFGQALELLQPFGVVPTMDFHRRIVNQVAKRAGVDVASDIENLASVSTKIGSLIDDIAENPKSWAGREKELFERITSGLDGYGDIMARYGGRADADNIYRTWTSLGGVAPANTGLPKKINEARRAASNMSLSPQERLEAQNFLNASRSMEAIAEERKNYYDNVVVKWFQSTKGYKPSNVHEANNALREMRKVSAGRGRLAEDAGYEEQLKWLRSVQAGLDESARKLRRNRGWVVQASDPFLDYSKLRIGQGVNPMNLPQSYYQTLRQHAIKWDRRAAELKEQTDQAFAVSSELSKARGPASAAAAAREAFGRPRASLEDAALATGVPVKELEDARRIYREAAQMRSSLEYVAAIEREELNGLLLDLALFDVKSDSPMPLFRSPLSNTKSLMDAGESVYVANPPSASRAYKRIKNAGELSDSTTYYVFRPSEAYPSVASVERLDTRIKTLRKEIANLKKNVDRESASIDGWYASERKMLDKRDAFAKRDLDAELRNRRNELANKRVQIEEKQALVAQLNSQFQSSWSPIQSSYQGNVRYRSVNPETGEPMDVALTFSKAEYNALFLSPQQMASRAGVITRKVKSIDDAVTAESNLISDLTDEIMKLREEIGARRSKTGDALLRQRDEANARLGTLLEQRDELVQERNAMRPEVQQAALEKARILHQQIKDGAVSKDELLRGMKSNGTGTAPDVVERRTAVLNEAWNASLDKKYLDGYRALENSIQYEIASSALETTGSAIRYAEELRAKADEAWGMFADEDAPWGLVETAGELVARDKPVLGVAGIHRRLTETDTELRKALDGLSSSTGNQIDAVAKFESLTTGGASTKEAIEQIIEEAKTLRPEDATFLNASKLAELVARRQDLMDEFGFWKSFGQDALNRMWGTNGLLPSLGGRRYNLIQEADKLRKQIDAIMPDWAGSQRELIDTALANVTKAERELAKAELTYTRAAIAFDQGQLSKMKLKNWYSTVVKPIRERRSQIVNRLDEIAKMAAKKENGDFKIAELLDWLDEFDGELYDIVGAENFGAIERLRADALAAQERLLLADDSMRDAKDIMRALENHEWGAIIEYDARKGWKSLASSGLPSYQARREIAQIVENFSRIQQPAFVRSLNKFIGSYTGFFKAYATATPGFIVRNTLSNTFGIVAAGADPRAMAEGLNIFREWNQALKTGTGGAEKWLASMPKAKREMVELAIKSMDASGYGRVGEAFAMWRPGRKWLVDNRYIEKFRAANKVTEDSARFILAWDSVARGADFDTAVARVKRHLFDYQNVSSADEVLRSIIPFWFWMSRNLPLQLTNQWINPKAYSIYNSFSRAVTGDQEEDPLLPSWMREAGALRLGGDMYLMPDLGFQRVQEQLSELGQPKRVLSYVNPALRLPVELLGGRKLYNDTPFGTQGQQAPGGPLSAPIQALAELLGQSSMTREGQMGVTPKFAYGVRNLIPPLAQAERLVPSTEYGEQAQLSSILSYLGIPLREVTPLQRETEARRQRREQQEGR
jgi:hypothetical protein